jgi:ribonuclease III
MENTPMPKSRKADSKLALSPQRIRSAQKKLGYDFENKALLAQAFCHASTHNDGYATNERLEFLGDAVLNMLVSWFLHEGLKAADEGTLSKRRSQMTAGTNLARIARKLKLGELLRTGKGQDMEPTDKMEGDLFEACIGAIFLDGGLEAAQEFVLREVASAPMPQSDSKGFHDPKSRLQHLALSRHLGLPEYRLQDVIGPGHALDFTMEVYVDGKCVGKGKGSSKKIAAQFAATEGLELLGEADEPDSKDSASKTEASKETNGSRS